VNRWRVGRKLGRTLYRDDRIVGMVDTKEIAAEIVEAMNARECTCGTKYVSRMGESLRAHSRAPNPNCPKHGRVP
jgi:hypothetical protein